MSSANKHHRRLRQGCCYLMPNPAHPISCQKGRDSWRSDGDCDRTVLCTPLRHIEAILVLTNATSEQNSMGGNHSSSSVGQTMSPLPWSLLSLLTKSLTNFCIMEEEWITGVERWPSGLGRRPATGRSMVRWFDGSSPTSVNKFALLFGTLAIPFTLLASVFRMRH